MVRPSTSDYRDDARNRRESSAVSQSLAHMHGEAAHKRLLAVNDVTEAAIESDIRSEELVRVETKLRQAKRSSEPLGMLQQTSAQASSLMIRRNGDVHDEQMVRAVDGLDQASQKAVGEKEIDPMVTDRLIVIGAHRQWFAADERDPFRICGTAQRAYGSRVFYARDSYRKFFLREVGHVSLSRPAIAFVSCSA